MQREYGKSVLKQILHYATLYNITSFDTLFVGGGTPLTMGAQWFLQLRDELSLHNLISSLTEWTVELNPENITKNTLDILSDAGVNRLSVGVQSLDDAVLTQMGRGYTVDFLQERLREAEAGTDNLSVDLIYGMDLPRSLKNELQTLFETISPHHLSCYSYSLPHKTTHLKQSSEESIIEEEREIAEQLTKRGFSQYEVSNWALDGRESLHNLGYWRSETYLGIGTAAHSFIPAQSERLHWSNNIRSFVEGGAPIVEKVTRQEEIKDFLLMGLRVSEGISFERFFQRFGVAFYHLFKHSIHRLSAEKLIMIDNKSVRMTHSGMQILNDVLLILFKDISHL